MICDFRYAVQVLLDPLVQLDRLETLVLLVRQGQLVLQESQDPLEVEALQVSPEEQVYQAQQVTSELQDP